MEPDAEALEGFPAAGRDLVRGIVRGEGFAGVVGHDQAQRLCSESGLSTAGLMVALVPFARLLARPPISSFRVGVVARGSSGSLYLGANVELPGQALNFSVHAEQAAVTNAWLHAETGLEAIAASAAPCGHCRQFLFETATASTMAVVMSDGAPIPLVELLPRAFGPANLGVAGRLMNPEHHGLRLDTGDPVVLAALEAAEASYAPYSGNFAGVALRTASGAVLTGRHAENAAFNPSLSPAQGAYAMWALRGDLTDAITRAVLVERPTEASQADATTAALSSIAPGVALEVYQATAEGSA